MDKGQAKTQRSLNSFLVVLALSAKKSEILGTIFGGLVGGFINWNKAWIKTLESLGTVSSGLVSSLVLRSRRQKLVRVTNLCFLIYFYANAWTMDIWIVLKA